MKMSSVTKKILWAAIEDYAGLWELVWDLATSCPEVAETRRQSVAEHEVRELLERNCIVLYERHEIGGHEKVVSRERWDELLSDKRNWHEPTANAREVLIGATSIGERLYKAEVGD